MHQLKNQNINFIFVDSEDMLIKGVNGLRAALSRIENEIKHHQQPKSPIDLFGEKMSVSFLTFAFVHDNMITPRYDKSW